MAPDHGTRLTREEYQRRVWSLHSGLPESPDAEQQRDVRKRELDLAIDFHLGRDFPLERREALWQIQRRIHRRRFRVMAGYLINKAIGRSLHKMAKGLAGFVVNEYAKVLSDSELEQWFGKDVVEDPGLPVDFD